MKFALTLGDEGFEPKYGLFKDGVELSRHSTIDSVTDEVLRLGVGKQASGTLFLDRDYAIAWLGGYPDPQGQYPHIRKPSS